MRSLLKYDQIHAIFCLSNLILISGEWQCCGRAKGDKYIHRVFGLQKGVQYLFRVTATNQSGSSSYAQSHSTITTFGTSCISVYQIVKVPPHSHFTKYI